MIWRNWAINSFCGSKDLEWSCWAILVRLISGWILANPNCYPRATMVHHILNHNSTQVIHDLVLITIWENSSPVKLMLFWGRWSLIDISFISHKENCVCKGSNVFDRCSETVALPSPPLFAILQISISICVRSRRLISIWNEEKESSSL